MDPQSLKQLENIVRIAPELSPLQLKMGMGRRENASSIDPTLQNLDRIRFEKKKIMKKSNYVTSKLSDIIRFQDECDNNFIRKMVMDGKHKYIIMQDDDMIRLMKDADGPLETDTVEGFLCEPNLEGKSEPVLTITSAYDFLLTRWVPIVYSIMIGRTAGDYQCNTCRLDSILTVIFNIEQDRKSTGQSSLLVDLDENHVLCRAIDYLEAGNDSMAREVLADRMEPSSDGINDWFGGLTDCYEDVFKDILGAVFRTRKHCMGCNKDMDFRKHSSSYRINAYK